MKYIESKNGYFYKIKNNTTTRISKTEYLKKVKKGGAPMDIDPLDLFYPTQHIFSSNVPSRPQPTPEEFKAPETIQGENTQNYLLRYGNKLEKYIYNKYNFMYNASMPDAVKSYYDMYKYIENAIKSDKEYVKGKYDPLIKYILKK